MVDENEIEESDQRSNWKGKSVEQFVPVLCCLGAAAG